MSRQFAVDWRLIYGYTNYTHPTGNLDSRTTVEVMGLLKNSCKKYNQTMMMVTHNESLAVSCDRILHIEDGRLLNERKGE